MEQVLLTMPEHLKLPPDYSGTRLARSLISCVMFYRSLLVLLWCVHTCVCDLT